MAALTLLQAILTTVVFKGITRVLAQPKFPTILVFGDSTVDTGNNNYVTTLLKSNFYPYGNDFSNHIPTGRFSNGKLIPDFLASSLNIKDTVPPFLDPKLSDDDIRTGVVFASAGSGYDDLTTTLTRVIPVSKQLPMFQNYITRLKGIVGEEEANKIIGDAFIIISAGTNDLILNFYDLPTRKPQFHITGYHDFVLNRLKDFVKGVYNLGGRSFAIAGLPPIGCLPIQMTAKLQNPKNMNCIEDQNADSRAYNEKLVKLLSELQGSLLGSRIAYANYYDPLINMVNQPQKYGFVETKRGCCGTGLLELSFLCNAATPLCSNASQNLFWDSIHPSKAAYKFLSDSILKEILAQFSPM